MKLIKQKFESDCFPTCIAILEEISWQEAIDCAVYDPETKTIYDPYYKTLPKSLYDETLIEVIEITKKEKSK